MEFSFYLYNGFNLGLERAVHEPKWVEVVNKNSFHVYYFTGLIINLGFIRIELGRFIDGEELQEELQE